jgi:hypothetical protein
LERRRDLKLILTGDYHYGKTTGEFESEVCVGFNRKRGLTAFKEQNT